MVLANFNYLSNEYKDKFLKMCLLLFPQYKSASINKKGIVTFISKNSILRRTKIPFINLVSHDLLMRLSVLRWNSTQLANSYLKVLLEINEKYKHIKNPTVSEQLKMTQEVIDYLYSQFLITNLKDIYTNYCNVVSSKDNIEVVDDVLKSSFKTTVFGNIKTATKYITYENLYKDLHKGLVISSISIITGILVIMYILLGLPIKSTYYTITYQSALQEFPWKIM
ncbi:MAG: hypothetical protein WC346_05710 [Methanogenium sp.]|jgi:hypothetical protein